MPKGHQLRKYRYSIEYQIYFVTTCTHARKNYFNSHNLAREVVRAIYFQDKTGRTKTMAYVIMPDHIHWLFELKQSTLQRVLQSFKSYTAKFVEGQLWQHGYYEHAVRKSEDLVKLSRYIVANPLRAGLVENIGDYSYWDAVWLEN